MKTLSRLALVFAALIALAAPAAAQTISADTLLFVTVGLVLAAGAAALVLGGRRLQQV